MAFSISVDKEKCIGCGACAGICENFKMVDGKAEPDNPKVDEIGCNQDAADSCPVQAITVKEL